MECRIDLEQIRNESNIDIMNTHEMFRFYEQGLEEGRLSQGLGAFEKERMQCILKQFLPSTPSVIADIGGGAGAHAFWLTELGYTVHFSDIIPLHIKQAELYESQTDLRLASKNVCDARHLPYDDQFFDMALCIGPLYHLLDRRERLDTLLEASRVLRNDGILVAGGISHFASTIVGLQQGWVFNDIYMDMCRDEINTGKHQRPEQWPSLFVDAHFHDPDELASEIKQTGFHIINIVGIEGLAWLAPDFKEILHDECKRRVLLEIAQRMEKLPAVSPHYVVVAQKTD